LLQSEDGEISGLQAIHEHIYKFYMGLMGTKEPKFLALQVYCGPEGEKVSDKENKVHALSFSMKDLDEVLKDKKKTSMAPRPDGFLVAFFKKNWNMLKDLVF
jgi:hypothetical protein